VAEARVHRIGGAEKLEFVWRFSRDALDAFRRLHARSGPTVELGLLGQRFVSITDPSDIRHVLKVNHRNYGKGQQYSDFEPLWGKVNLLASHGAEWTRQRRVCAADFSPPRAADQQQLILRHARRLLPVWDQSARVGERRLLYQDLRRLVLNVLFEDWFGVADQRLVATLSDVLNQLTGLIGSRVFSFVKLPAWLPTPERVRFKRLLRQLNDQVAALIRGSRSNEAEQPQNLIGRLLRAEADGTDATELHNNVVVFALAAYETPSLGWTLYRIASNPEVMSRVCDEVRSELGADEPTLEALPRLRYLRMCIDEAQRLDPSAPFLVRQALAPDRLGDYVVEAGVNIVTPTCVMHMLPELWPEPERFRPERFADARSIPEFGYLPFGRGARECIGRSIALQLMLTTLAVLFQRFSVVLSPGSAPRRFSKFAPYPSDSVPARLIRHA
jgi:cytochrome P450